MFYCEVIIKSQEAIKIVQNDPGSPSAMDGPNGGNWYNMFVEFCNIYHLISHYCNQDTKLFETHQDLLHSIVLLLKPFTNIFPLVPFNFHVLCLSFILLDFCPFPPASQLPLCDKWQK